MELEKLYDAWNNKSNEEFTFTPFTWSIRYTYNPKIWINKTARIPPDKTWLDKFTIRTLYARLRFYAVAVTNITNDQVIDNLD